MNLHYFYPLIYLAVGYSNNDHEESARRSDIAAAYLMEVFGLAVFAPITQSHRVSAHVAVGNMSHEFWLGHDVQWMDQCMKLYVLQDGSEKDSFGVAFEIGYFTAQRKEIKYLPLEEVEEWLRSKDE